MIELEIPITVLVRALGYGTDTEILLNYLAKKKEFLATIQKDNAKTKEEGLIEIYKRLRPGEPPTVDSATYPYKQLVFRPKEI